MCNKRIVTLLVSLLPVISISSALANDVNIKNGLIKVEKSTYETTPVDGFKYCDATSAVQAICNGKVSCSFPADDTLCGDPSPGNIKQLITEYDCEGTVIENITMEFDTATFDCSSIKKIKLEKNSLKY